MEMAAELLQAIQAQLSKTMAVHAAQAVAATAVDQHSKTVGLPATFQLADTPQVKPTAFQFLLHRQEEPNSDSVFLRSLTLVQIQDQLLEP